MNVLHKLRLYCPLALAAALAAAPPTAQAGVNLSLGQNFAGVSYGAITTNSSALPPDANGAVGTGYFVEFINGAFAIYSKTNGTQQDFKTDVDFWAAAHVGIDLFNAISDPRVIYDPVSQRWFASQIDIDAFTQAFEGITSSNHFLLAVSSTSDPTGQWRGVIFPSDPVNFNFADFPTLGVDGQGVYLAGDMFDANGDPSDPTTPDIGQTLVSIPKQDLLTGDPNTFLSHETWFGIMDNSEHGQVLQPVTCADGGSVGKVLSVTDIGTTSAPHSNLVVSTLLNVTNFPATNGPTQFPLVSPFVVPDNVLVPYPLLTATQPDGSSRLQANDARFSARVYSVGGVLYGVHNTELNSHIAIRWYRVHASDGVVLESGTLADANLDLFYPSIAANPAGTVVIAYNGGGLSSNISCYAVAGQTLSGTTRFGSPVLLRAGTVSYHGDDEDPTGQFGSPTSRWGDYSAVSLDPVDSNRFWTIQMFPSGIDIWTTQITELITAVTPELYIAKAGTNVTVSWSTQLTGFQLQATTNLVPPVTWSNITQVPITNGNTASLPFTANSGRQFFRLKK